MVGRSVYAVVGSGSSGVFEDFACAAARCSASGGARLVSFDSFDAAKGWLEGQVDGGERLQTFHALCTRLRIHSPAIDALEAYHLVVSN